MKQAGPVYPGIPDQDIVMCESMGPIAGRKSESLGASDIAIVAFRRIEAAKRMQAGGPAIGTGRSARRMRVRARLEESSPKTQVGGRLAALPKPPNGRSVQNRLACFPQGE